MTAFGKILVFLNLVFALVTGGLIGMVYLTRTNWYAAYQTATADAGAQKAAYDQWLLDEMGQVTAKERDVKKAQQERDALAKERDTVRADAEQAKNQLAATQRTNDNASENVKTTTAELERRRNEVRQLADSNARFSDRIRDLEKQLAKTRDQYVTADLNNKALKERMDSVLASNEDLNRRLNQLERGGGSTSARAGMVPPEQVRGTVKAVEGMLVTISVGTDAGVNKDNILYVYRLTPTPEYLGELQILTATPFEAVGRLRPSRRSVSVKPGDEVGSKILGPK